MGTVHSLPQEESSEAANWAAGQFDASGSGECQTVPGAGVKTAGDQPAFLAPQPLLRQAHLCSLSKSDTRLHELHRGQRSTIGEFLGTISVGLVASVSYH